MATKITTISDFIRELERIRDKEGDLPILRECFDEDSTVPEYYHLDCLDDCEVVERTSGAAVPVGDHWAYALNQFITREGLEKALILK